MATNNAGSTTRTVLRILSDVVTVSIERHNAAQARDSGARVSYTLVDGRVLSEDYASYEVLRRFLRSRRLLKNVRVLVYENGTVGASTCGDWPHKLI